jgi:probable phosphomutase (TIGR03848 family)
MTYVLLVRHGQNDWVQKRRLAGWTPGIHLNEEGREQVDRLAGRLTDLPIKAIYSSPLERCLETAEAVGSSLRLGVSQLPAVGEVRYGKWEGKKVKKVSRKKRSWYAVQHYPSRFRFPGGETLREVQDRAVAALEELCAKHKDEMILVVSHADVIKLLLAHYLGVHIDLFQRLIISPASVSALQLSDGGLVRVLRINDDGPLQAPSEHGDNEAAATDEDEPEEEKTQAQTAEPAEPRIGTAEALAVED